ncbi:MAG: hypothetical protein JWO15_2743 [Sphingomonadales bacterium]|nr:hypothetical protein [Sphingomonadales bacterium]
MLTARLDAQEAVTLQQQNATRDVQAQAAAATAQAQAAQATATTAADTVPAQVKTALAANAPKASPAAWFNDTSISGRMYFNASNINQQLNGGKTAATGTGFNIKRFYLGVDHKFDKTFSANLTMDISNVVGRTNFGNFAGNTIGIVPPTTPGGTPTLTQSDYGVVGKGFYVKKAYLQAKINPALIVRVGAADLPWVPYVEGIYGYRHIENTIIDEFGFGTSADWGVHVLGDLAGGIVSYQVSVINGAGYRNVKVTKSVDVEGRVSVAYKGFFGAVGGYTGKLGADVQNAAVYHTATRLDGLAGYKNKLFTIGAEYFYAKNYTNNGQTYITQVAGDKGEGYSVFGSVNFAPKFSLFGRYDREKPRKNALPSLKSDYFNVGVQYSPAKIVDLALVYKRDKVNGGQIGTQNGVIGLTGVNNEATYDEFGLFGQFRF